MVSGGQAARAPGLPVQARGAILMLRLCSGRGRASPGAVRLPGPLGGRLPASRWACHSTLAGTLGQCPGSGLPVAHVSCFCVMASLRTREGQELEMRGVGTQEP